MLNLWIFSKLFVKDPWRDGRSYKKGAYNWRIERMLETINSWDFKGGRCLATINMWIPKDETIIWAFGSNKPGAVLNHPGTTIKDILALV